MKVKLLGVLGGFALGAASALAQAPGVIMLVDEQLPAPTAVVPAPAAAPECDCCCASDGISEFNIPSSDANVWLNVDYLLWWVKRGPLPTPLVATGSPNDPFPGALDQPGSRVLYGGHGIDENAFNGIRLSGGMFLDRDSCLGIEGSYFALERRSTNFTAGSDANGNPLIGRPFNDALTGNENLYFDSISFGGVPLVGGVSVTSDTRLDGWDTNLVYNVCRDDSLKLNLLAGYRYMHLREDIDIHDLVVPTGAGSGLTFVGASVDPPNSLADWDHFGTDNQFNGGQLGAELNWTSGRFDLGLVTKVALGTTQEVVTIAGSSAELTPGKAPLVAPGGIFALGSNIGRYSRDQFAVVPELDLNLGVQLQPWLRARVGYSFLYWSEVARPGNQIDRSVNPNLVPTDPAFGTPGGPARPAFSFASSDFWAQGINFGLEFSF